MRGRLLGTLLSAALGCLQAESVPPPRWGGNNETLAWSALVNMTDFAEVPDHPHWQFQYYYNWNLRADRYEHGVGQRDEVCQGVPNHPWGEPCTVLNAVDGMLYLLFPTTNDCCRCRPGLVVRSDWLQDGGTSYQGQTTIRDIKVDEWLKYGDNHYYATADSSQKMVRYMEHKAGSGGQIKQWDVVNYDSATPSDDLFSAPSGCSRACGSLVCGLSDELTVV